MERLSTQICSHSIHVGIVPLPSGLIATPVAVSEEAGGVVCDEGKDH